jgi:hypothetical protein
MLTSDVELFRRVKVMEQDLFSFILIRHFSNQTLSICIYKCLFLDISISGSSKFLMYEQSVERPC